MSTIKGKKIMVPVGAIKLDIFVREKLSDERVLFFVDLIENKVEVPAIEITEDEYQLVDGRHRYEAHIILDRPEIECVLVKPASREELIIHALSANVGGALPPSPDDFVHTFRLLVNNGVSRRRILELTSEILPKELAKRYLSDAQSAEFKANMALAVQAVLDGMTVQDASEKFGVELGKLKQKLSGARKEKRKGLPQTKSHLTTLYKSHSGKVSKVFQQLIADFRDGEKHVTRDVVEGVFSHVEQLATNSLRNVAQWRQRYEALQRQMKKG